MSEEAPAAAVVRRLLPAPPDVVYDEWLDPEGMTEWMCPAPARPTDISLDPRVGGRIRIEIDDEGFLLSITGEYLQLERPRRLSFTWTSSTWGSEDRASVVTVVLEPHGEEETLMTIRHAQLPPGVLDAHEAGWSLIAAQLESRLQPPRPSP